jgi:two-component system, NarL family, sensor kinase
MSAITRLYAVLFFVFISCTVNAQELMNKDSLLKVLGSAKADTNRVLLYISIGQQYENNQPDSAIYYYTQAKLWSEKINYPVGLIKYVNNITYVYNMQGKLDSALQLNLYSVTIAEKINDKRRLAFCLANTAVTYMKMEQYENAVDYFLKATKILEALNNKEQLHVLYNDLSILYAKMRQYARAIQFGRQAVEGSRSLNDSTNLGNALGTLATALISANKSSDAEKYLREGIDISRRTNNKYLLETLLINLSRTEMLSSHIDRQLSANTEALKLAKELDDAEGITISYRLLATYYFNKKDFVQASTYAGQALQVAKAAVQPANEQQAYLVLSDIALGLQNMADYSRFRRQYDSIDQLLLNQQIIRHVKEMETRFEAVKKDDRIHQLEKENQLKSFLIRQKNMLNGLLIAASILILIISLLSYKSYRQRQLLQKNKIQELEKEQQLMATEALLKGQEDERIRLAKDLHDGLGGMLSGIKYSLNAVKGNLIMTTANAQSFERSIDMLDASINEMRRVAHNLMPEALVKFGLHQSLQDFSNDVNSTGVVRLRYQSIGIENTTIDQAVEITVFRVIQELVNNVLKHASATELIVQLTKAADKITITVEDDGIGFDAGNLKNSGGIGWGNIRSRINYLKGRIDIRSKQAEGSSVYIEIPI